MEPLREACILAKGLDARELELLALFVDLLQADNPLDPIQALGQARYDYQKARVNAGLPVAVATTKAPTRKPTKRKSKTKSRRRHVHTGQMLKVWEAMQQSSGELTANELAEVLEMPKKKVSTILSKLTEQHPSILRRTWVKGGLVGDGTVAPSYYLYQYVGKGGDQ